MSDFKPPFRQSPHNALVIEDAEGRVVYPELVVAMLNRRPLNATTTITACTTTVPVSVSIGAKP
jgi:hypothetical protein